MSAARGDHAARALAASVAFLVAIAGSSPASADDAEVAPDRLEWAVIPALGGDTDVGFIFGAIVVLARYLPEFDPYRWRMQIIAVATVKDGPSGVDFPVQNYRVDWDLPGLAGGRLRLRPRLEFYRSVNAGYYGIGNASRPTPLPPGAPGDPGRREQYVRLDVEGEIEGRLGLGYDLELAFGLIGRYVQPSLYEGSQLAEDVAAQAAGGPQRLYATGESGRLELRAGLLYDTRDHETVPTCGMFHELALRFGVGFPPEDEVRYGGLTVRLRFYVPLLAPYLVLALRAVTDHLWGNPPFYELARGGTFPSFPTHGGARGIRGVPLGRYYGLVRVLASVELRSMFWSFTLLGGRFRLGAAAFVDTGRVWSDYGSPRALDGSGLGLQVGVGGGLRLQWGESVQIRIDVAWSPDVADAVPSRPVGVYMDLQEAF